MKFTDMAHFVQTCYIVHSLQFKFDASAMHFASYIGINFWDVKMLSESDQQILLCKHVTWVCQMCINLALMFCLQSISL